MAILLDTDVIIQGEREIFDLKSWVGAQGSEPIEIAAITAAELWHGVERASRIHKAKREKYVRAILQVLPVIPYTAVTAMQHAQIWAQLEFSGKMIGDYDLIIAATALERGSAIATFNTKHFALVPGLTMIEPK
jgi:tRNA(fMet)-specific endonuclease VapC